MTRLIALALLILLCLPTTALAAPSPEIDSLRAVKRYLNSPNFLCDRTDLKKVDEDPIPELIHLATKGGGRTKTRALKCLSLYPDPRTLKAFKKLLRRKPDKDFRVLVLAYGEAFGEESVGDLKPFLKDKRKRVRKAVRKSLKLFGGQKGHDVLVDHAFQNDDVETAKYLHGVKD